MPTQATNVFEFLQFLVTSLCGLALAWIAYKQHQTDATLRTASGKIDANTVVTQQAKDLGEANHDKLADVQLTIDGGLRAMMDNIYRRGGQDERARVAAIGDAPASPAAGSDSAHPMHVAIEKAPAIS